VNAVRRKNQIVLAMKGSGAYMLSISFSLVEFNR